jgi:hypothetical protein
MSRNPSPPRSPPMPVVPSKMAAPRPVVLPAAASLPPLATVGSPVSGTSEYAGQDVVVARAATYYRMTRYTMVLVLVGMGGWFGYDGFKGWPNENVRIADINKRYDAAMKTSDFALQDTLKADSLLQKPKHTATDILIQKLLAFGLPALGVAMLAWALRKSRGAYRLGGTTLTVPGHPPVQLDEILEIDKQLWDRKGIAYLTYRTAAGRKGRILLDDFIYERDPTDEIYKRAEDHVAGHAVRA